MSLRKTFKNLFRKSVGGKKKKHKKKKRVSRKGRGYVNECIIPAPYNEIKQEDSCSIIDLQDDYGDVELPEELRGKKECNMYYYIKDGKYYRCRNGRGKKCSKTGKFGSGKTKCNNESVARLEEGNIPLEAILQELVNPMPSVVVLPSVPKSFPSVPNTPVNPNLVNRNVTSTRSQLPRSSMPGSTASLNMPTANIAISQLDRAIKQQENLNQKIMARKLKLDTDSEKPRITKNMQAQMKRMSRKLELDYKRNERAIKNLTQKRNRLASLR
tara:strand:- start:122 stop:934 length:813 start_codon:yes stop_codon:yes gene_type:complete